MTNKLRSIIIVEDERIVARDLKFTLEDLGYRVPAIASSGEQAIHKVSEYLPDLVLMDIRLKGQMDGITTAQIIAKKFNTPVVYLTAHSDEETLVRAKETYPLGYIIKPFDKHDLRIILDIALHKHIVDRQMKDEAQWLSTLLNSIGDGVIATDVDGYITLLNPVAEKLTAWSCKDAVGLTSSQVFHIIDEHSRKPIDNPIQKVLETHEKYMLPENTLLIRKDGTEIPIEDSAAPIFSSRSAEPNGVSESYLIGSVLVFRDMSLKIETAKKLQRQAFYDNLTNLPNRAWFRERLTDALERIKRQPNYSFAVLLIDLDHFKMVNDGMGHEIGDRLLAAVAERLISACRVIDTIARLGGDEFIILLENIHGESEVETITRRIQNEISTPFTFNGQEVFTTASIGLVICSSENDAYKTIDDLLRDADIAMYQAKAKGRACYRIFDTAMRQMVIQSSQIENDLRRVLERQELDIHYQPIFCLATGKLGGFEALVRWQHPTRGLVSPNEFLSIADDIGIGVYIDRWVLSTACKQILDWQSKYSDLSDLNLNININISPKHFIQTSPLKWVSEALAESGFPPQNLNLEITENLLIENAESAISILTEIKKLGILFSIDDFGTGYSSLSYLQRFPIDVIKIDRSFVNNMTEGNKDSIEIVRAIILLGQVLSIKIVAEGIETFEQLSILQKLNCNFGQGYYFSRPAPKDEVEILIESEMSKIQK
jgi:diguanylate cyclase (GGDEF)-like protein/PAS domain S-box-containing protein